MKSREEIITAIDKECVKINLRASSGQSFDEQLLMTLYDALEHLNKGESECQ